MIKAIGKGSLATILAVGLHVVRVIVWIAFVGLTTALVIAPLLPFLAEWASKAEGVNFEEDIDFGGQDFVKLLYHFITFGVMLYVIERLLELLRTLRLGSPFVKENADRFKRVGFALLFGEAAKILIGIAAAIFDADVDIDIELITFLSIAAVFVLAEVFSEGARMKEEQDLTV
jgi:hypothetical protein